MVITKNILIIIIKQSWIIKFKIMMKKKANSSALNEDHSGLEGGGGSYMHTDELSVADHQHQQNTILNANSHGLG